MSRSEHAPGVGAGADVVAAQLFRLEGEPPLNVFVTAPGGHDTLHDITVLQDGAFALRGLVSRLPGSGDVLLQLAGDLRGRARPTPGAVAAIALLGASLEDLPAISGCSGNVQLDLGCYTGTHDIWPYVAKLGFEPEPLISDLPPHARPLPSVGIGVLRQAALNHCTPPAGFTLALPARPAA